MKNMTGSVVVEKNHAHFSLENWDGCVQTEKGALDMQPQLWSGVTVPISPIVMPVVLQAPLAFINLQQVGQKS